MWRQPFVSGIWAMEGIGPVRPECVGPSARVVNRVDGATLIVGELPDVVGALLSEEFHLDSLRRALSD